MVVSHLGRLVGALGAGSPGGEQDEVEELYHGSAVVLLASRHLDMTRGEIKGRKENSHEESKKEGNKEERRNIQHEREAFLRFTMNKQNEEIYHVCIMKEWKREREREGRSFCLTRQFFFNVGVSHEHTMSGVSPAI